MAADARTRLLRDFFTACNDSELRWTLLRGKATLFTPGKDVDLLVDPAHQPLFEEVVRSFGGVVPPGRLHPAHRTYRLGRPLRDAVPLDVVTRLAYSRERQLRSGLEQGCLDRRVRDGWLYELDATDLFWTVLLHCVLDKRHFTERRIAELRASLPGLTRPSDGERFAVQVLPDGWSPDRLLTCVAAEQFAELAALGVQLSPPPPSSAVRRHRRWGLDATAGRIYNRVWLSAGLGAAVRADAVLDDAGVPALVTEVRRVPGRVAVLAEVPAGELSRAGTVLRRAGYRRAADHWSRLGANGLEMVRLSAAPWFPDAAGRPSAEVRALPLGGRQHCRWAVGSRGPEQRAREGAR